MNPIHVLGIAFGLAMDAFAVAVAASVAREKLDKRCVFRLSFHFGLFQFFMPILGWAAGLTVEGLVKTWDHWAAFVLLSAIGGKMLYESTRGAETAFRGDPTRGLSLVILSVATSIDALAVGFSFAMLGADVWYPAAVIGGVAFLMTALGMVLGSKLGARFGKKSEAAGGLVLIAIGAKILAEHLLA